jgi:hypothetical protein
MQGALMIIFTSWEKGPYLNKIEGSRKQDGVYILYIYYMLR